MILQIQFSFMSVFTLEYLVVSEVPETQVPSALYCAVEVGKCNEQKTGIPVSLVLYS